MNTHNLKLAIVESSPYSEERGRDCKWRASSLDKCPRLQILETLGYKIPPTNEQKWVMAFGELIHKKVQETILTLYPDTLVEIAVNNPEINVGGTLDIIIPVKGK